MCNVFNINVVSEVTPASFIREGPPCPCEVKKYVCDPELIPSPDRSCFCKARGRESRQSTFKGELQAYISLEECVLSNVSCERL